MKPLKEISSLFKHLFDLESKRDRLQRIYEDELKSLLYVDAFNSISETIDFIEKVDFISHNYFGGGYTKSVLRCVAQVYAKNFVDFNDLRNSQDFWIALSQRPLKDFTGSVLSDLKLLVENHYADLKQRIEEQ